MTRCLRKSICDWNLNLIFFRSLKLPTAWGLGWVKRRKNFPSLSVSYLKLAIFTFADLLKVYYVIKNTLDLENCFATKMLKFPWVSFFFFYFWQCYKLFTYYIVWLHAKGFKPARWDLSFVLPGSCFCGTKFFHLITSACVSGMKNQFNTCLRKKIKRKCKQI